MHPLPCQRLSPCPRLATGIRLENPWQRLRRVSLWVVLFWLGTLLGESAIALSNDEQQGESEPGVEEVAQEQAVNLGFVTPDLDQQLFNDNGTVDKGGEQTKARLLTSTKMRIESLTHEIGLTTEQQQKLELAARGDIVHLFDRIEAIREKFRAGEKDQNQVNQLWQEIQPLQTTLHSRRIESGPFLRKAIHNVLSQDQLSQFEKLELERRRFHYRSAIEIQIAHLELWIPLIDEQREQLIELTLNETQLPRSLGGQYGLFAVLIQMSKLPKEKLQKVLDPVQCRLLDQALGQVQGMEQWLIQMEVLDPDPEKK